MAGGGAAGGLEGGLEDGDPDSGLEDGTAGGLEGGSAHGLEGAYYTEMPLTWYVERELWDLSPGYTQVNQRFDRPITLDCLTCHNGRPGHEPSQNFFADVPLGITCERCHGPGSAHVSAFEAGGEPSDSRIVNPADLPTDLQLDVCQQCHLTGETVYAPGHDATTYRPGRPLSAHRSVYVTQASIDDPDDFGIASHARAHDAERVLRREPGHRPAHDLHDVPRPPRRDGLAPGRPL